MIATMNPRLFRWGGAAAVLAGYLALTGCSTVRPDTGTSCFSCDDQRVVRLVPFARISGADQGERFKYPLNLTPVEWETTVRSVMVRSIHSPLLGPSYQGPTEPVFSEEEVRYLGESLQRAFQQATTQQQVVFAVARSPEAGVDQLTSGAWFVEEGRIHLRLANCRVAVTMPSIRRQIWIDPLFAQTGTFYELVPGERQAFVSSSRGGGNPFRQEPVELAIDYKAMAGEAGATTPPGSASQPDPARTLEEQLALLKRLYEQGLITPEDYHTKKQQILDRL